MARLVTQEGLGWIISFVSELQYMLYTLQRNPDQLENKRRHILNSRERFTWEQLARKVAEILGEQKVRR